MRDYQFLSVPVGDSRRIAVDGDFFRVKESAQPLKVEYEVADGGTPAVLSLNETAYFRLPGGLYYTYVRVTNDGTAAVDLVVTCGFGDTGDNLLSGGVTIGDSTELGKSLFSSIRRAEGIVNPASNLQLQSYSEDGTTDGEKVLGVIHSGLFVNECTKNIGLTEARSLIPAHGGDPLEDQMTILVGPGETYVIEPSDNMIGLEVHQVDFPSPMYFKMRVLYWESV